MSLVLGLGKRQDAGQSEKIQKHKFESPASVLSCLYKVKEVEATTFQDVSKDNPFAQCFKLVESLRALPLLATRSLLEQKHEPLVELLASQNLHIEPSHFRKGSPDKWCASVTSLVSRLPPFDFADHEGKPYLRIKSPNIVIARYLNNPKAIEQIAIIPTDDERLKIIIIPTSVVANELNSSLMNIVRNVLSNMEIIE